MEDNQEWSNWVREVQHSGQPEIDQLKTLFERTTAQIIAFAEHEIELARALQDHEALVKVQIKMQTIKTARRIFGQSYRMVTGKRAWEERDER